MSGGERKKRGMDRGQGWEEAGAEFYQESYPIAIEADLQQVLQKDPSHLATLLPSKKSRVATSKRIRNDPKTTTRRRTGTRGRGTSTVRRTSMNVHDAASVSMLPDLSENLSNEERTWEEIMQIKAMPVCMAQKIQLKTQLQNATKLRLQGYDQLKWQRRKFLQRLRVALKETYSTMGIWKRGLKLIGGNFGTGIVAYFLYIKWLITLNLFLTLIFTIFLIVPTSMVPKNNETIQLSCDNTSTNYTSTALPFFFYDYYPAHKDLQLFYIMTNVLMYIFSLIFILKSCGKRFKERIMETEGQFYRYSNLIFTCGWDYCIRGENSSTNKHKSLYNEIKRYLGEDKNHEDQQNSTRDEIMKLFFIRLFINIIIISIFVVSVGLTYQILSTTADLNLNPDYSLNISNIFYLFMSYRPYIFVVLLNTLIPWLLERLIIIENYRTTIVKVGINLIRNIVLRIMNFIVILLFFYDKLINDDDCQRMKFCWERFLGEELMKFYTIDLIVQFVIIFFINFPRSFVARHTDRKFIQYFGKQEFDLSKNILDLVYLQTICWFASFYAPIFIIVGIVSMFFLFYMKKFHCLVNCTPTGDRIFRQSRTKSLTMVVTLIGFVAGIGPVIYSIFFILPSTICGPLKNKSNAWSVVEQTFHSNVPCWLKNFIYFIYTPGFIGFLLVGLVGFLFYYYSVSIANKQMVQVLKNQLILEGHDKQFLLNRLSAFIKQQQEQQQGKFQHRQEQINETGFS